MAVRPDAFPAGRFYFCEHLTPELVWRPEWQSHANNTTRFNGLLVVAENAAETAALTAKIVRSTTEAAGLGIRVPTAGDFHLLFQTPEEYAGKFGALARTMGDRSAMFGAVRLQGQLDDGLRQRLAGDEARFAVADVEDGVRVLVNPYETVINFAG